MADLECKLANRSKLIMKVTIEIDAPKITCDQVRKLIRDFAPDVRFESGASQGRIVGRSKDGQTITVAVSATSDEILQAMV